MALGERAWPQAAWCADADAARPAWARARIVDVAMMVASSPFANMLSSGGKKATTRSRSIWPALRTMPKLIVAARELFSQVLGATITFPAYPSAHCIVAAGSARMVSCCRSRGGRTGAVAGC